MMATPLIQTDQHFILFFILTACAYGGLMLEKVPYLSQISGTFATMFIAGVLSNFNIIPHDAPLYDLIWQSFIPLSIPFILMRANLREIINGSGPSFKAFLIGATGTVLGSLIAAFLVTIGPETWKVISMFCASYIGGSMNYVAVSKTLDLQNQDLFFAGNAADNVTMAIYFLTLAVAGSSSVVSRLFKGRDPGSLYKKSAATEEAKPIPLDLKNMLLVLLISTGIYTISSLISKVLQIKGIEIITTTLLILLLVNRYPNFTKRFIPYEILGYMFLQIFYAVIGASANVALAIQVAPKIILITFIIVGTHMAWTAYWGRKFNLGIKELIIASNANIGGPGTAAAMASARQWHELVVPGILCGTFGYAIATFIGTGLGYILHHLN